MVQNIFYNAPNLVCVCVDGRSGTDYHGRMYHCYQTGATQFDSLGSMMFEMDRFYDGINIPQAANAGRSFKTKKTTEGRTVMMKRVQKTEEITAHSGDIATFVVHVQYRQNATWQGKVIWSDQQQECNFRSALELIKMMDAAIDTTHAQPDEPQASN